MNKYQKHLLSLCTGNRIRGSFIFCNCAPVGEICNDDRYGKYDADTGCFTIKQDWDITKTVYELSISKIAYPCIDSVHVKKREAYATVPLTTAIDERFLITADFNDRIDAIRLKFIRNLTDDLEINIAYQEADKQMYAEKQEALRKENMLKRAAIKHAVGESLVNIYFQPCAYNYDHTEILLFIPEKTEVKRVGSPHGPVNQENVLSWSLIMKATVENGMFFKSVTGLAYGRYAYTVKQFDKNNILLLETGYIEFELKKPQPANPYHEIGINII